MTYGMMPLQKSLKGYRDLLDKENNQINRAVKPRIRKIQLTTA